MYKYIGCDISGYSPILRKKLFEKIQYIDEYTWYVNLGGSVSDIGEHYISIRYTDRKELDQVFSKLSKIKGYRPPMFYDLGETERPTQFKIIQLRFENKYPYELTRKFRRGDVVTHIESKTLLRVIGSSPYDVVWVSDDACYLTSYQSIELALSNNCKIMKLTNPRRFRRFLPTRRINVKIGGIRNVIPLLEMGYF